MLGILILLFIVLPMTELYLLFHLASAIGAEYAFALVIFTGILGGWLARRQGWQVYGRIQQDLSSGRMPKESLMDGGMILVAGALLITPGVMTDLFGFSLLFPPCRTLYRTWISKRFRGKFKIQTFGTMGQSEQNSTTWQSGNPEDVIDSHVVNRSEGED